MSCPPAPPRPGGIPPVVPVTALLVTLLSSVLTGLTTATASPGGVGTLLRALFPFLVLGHRRVPWGRVVVEGVNRPVPGATVSILDALRLPRATLKTRPDGTFGVLLPRGSYTVEVAAPGLAVTTDPQGLVLFPGETLYRGAPIAITSPDAIPAVVVGMQRGAGEPRGNSWLRRAWLRLLSLQSRLAFPILLAGAAVNTVSLLLSVTALLIAFEMVYGVLLCIELLLGLRQRRLLGRVWDADSGAPVGGAIVRVRDRVSPGVILSTVTTPAGQFLLLPPPGLYALEVLHGKYLLRTVDPLIIGPGVSAVRRALELQPSGRA